MRINFRSSVLFVAATSLAFAGSSCTRSQKNVEIAKREAAPAPGAGQQQQQQQQTLGTTSTSLEIPEAAITQYTSSRENLSYRFEYLTVKSENALNLVDGKATITVGSLPVDQVGVAKLEILESGVVKARGEAQNVKLTLAGPNNIDIKLASVNNGVTTPGTTNAIITVTLPGQTPTPTPSSSPVVTPITGPSTIPQPGPTANPTTWDGLADRGNEKWKIETVTQ